MDDSTAPITHLGLTVKFQPSLNALSIPELADLYAQFKDEFPTFNQVAPAGPMSYIIGQTSDDDEFVMPRVQFATADKSRSVVFQHDRMSFTWDRVTRLTSPADYPGFEKHMGEAMSRFIVIRRWIEETFFIEVSPEVGEVAYGDAFITHADLDKPKRLSSIFNFLNPDYVAKIQQYTYAWNELLRSETGFIVVKITGPALAPDGVPVGIMQTAATFQPKTQSWDGLVKQFLNVREEIGGVFRRVINQRADLTS